MKGLNKKVPNQKELKQRLIIQVTKQFKANYISDESSFGKRVINNIIYNEKSHCVALFKDYLLLDDSTEFLKRYYTKSESKERLPRFFEYYETYSKIFPNYTSIFEGKYIYRNIQKKQKMIDLQERMELEGNHNNKGNSKEHSDEVFSTDVYDSIINDRNNEDLEMVFNLNEHSIDFYDKIRVIVSDIEKNDTNHNHNSSNHNNSNQNIIDMPLNDKTPTNRHKLLISSLLGRNKYVNVNNKNGSIYIKDKPIFISYHNSCDSIGESQIVNSKIPLTDRVSSKQRTNNNKENEHKEKNQRPFSKTKPLYNYPKTIVIENPELQKLKTKDDIITPLTQRDNYKFKYNELTLTQLKEYNDKKKKSHKMYIKTPPKLGNNFTYIVNPNTKITTHVTLYNNNNNSSITSTKNTVNTQQLTGRTTSNAQSKVSSKRPSATFQYKSNVINSVNGECLTGRTRNTKTIISNNLMLKTTREQCNKNINLLRTTSQTTIPMKPNDKYYATKYTKKPTKSRPTSTTRTRSVSNHQSNKSTNIPPHKTESKRKKIAPSIHQRMHQQQQPKKKIVKGIHINNFSKVFSINCSQAASERIEKKNNQR